jgi:hydrogenase expression/formation protein HypC
MTVLEVSGHDALCDAKGIKRTVSLFLLQDEAISPGDHVIVHVGYAIQKVSEEDAEAARSLHEEMQEAGAAVPPAGGRPPDA